MKKNEFKVRDLRRKEKFFIDDDYINGYAKYLDTFATAVYLSICRHSDKEQTCFPSVRRIAEQHSMGEKTVRVKIKLLEEHNLIKVDRKRRNDGTWQNHTYFLLDKTQWKNYKSVHRSEIPVVHRSENHHPPVSDVHIHRSEIPHKVTHIKDTHIKEGKDLQLRYSSLKDINSELIQRIANDYQVPISFVENTRENLELWCGSKGKVYKNYNLALRSWVKKDMATWKLKVKRVGKGRGGVVDARTKN